MSRGWVRDAYRWPPALYPGEATSPSVSSKGGVNRLGSSRDDSGALKGPWAAGAGPSPGGTQVPSEATRPSEHVRSSACAIGRLIKPTAADTTPNVAAAFDRRAKGEVVAL